MANIETQLRSFKTKDGLDLPGLLYAAPRETRRIALYIHGNGSSSVLYNSNGHNTTAYALNKEGIAYFPFNNRGAHLIKSHKVKERKIVNRILYGCTYELIRECSIDIDAAISFLRKCGYSEFYLIGHSTGANKICVYDYYKKNIYGRNYVSKYVLLAGGDDTGLYYEALGKSRFTKALKVSKKYARSNKCRNIAPDSISPMYYMSYQSLYDTINPDGDYNIFPFNDFYNNLKLGKKKLFCEFSAIETQTLVVYGELDEYCIKTGNEALDVLESKTQHPEKMSFKLIKGADHGFSGHEKQLANSIARFLST